MGLVIVIELGMSLTMVVIKMRFEYVESRGGESILK